MFFKAPIKMMAALLAVTALVTGCDSNLSSNTYTSSSTGGKVLQGKIISVRNVTIKGADKLEQNALGGLAGGAAGAAAGSAIGGGSGRTGATVGGAIAGAVLGAVIQDQLGTSEGIEYLVKLDQKNMGNKAEVKKKRSKISYGKESVEDDIKADIEMDTNTDIISVVQQDEVPLAVGAKVYVIYSDDRPRVTAAQ